MCKYGTPLDHYMPFECGRTPFTHAKADYTAPDHKGRVIKHNRRLSCGVAKRYPVDKYKGLYGDGPIFQDRSELRGMHACRTCKNMTNSLGYNLSLELDPGEEHDTYAFHRMSALFGDPAEIKDQAAEQVPLPAQPFSPRGVANLIYFGLSTTQFVEIGKFFDLVWPSPYR